MLDISCKYRKSTDVKLKISFINIHSSQICRTAACTPGMCEFRGICHSNIILLITFSIIIFKSQLCCVVGALETKKNRNKLEELLRRLSATTTTTLHFLSLLSEQDTVTDAWSLELTPTLGFMFGWWHWIQTDRIELCKLHRSNWIGIAQSHYTPNAWESWKSSENLMF